MARLTVARLLPLIPTALLLSACAGQGLSQPGTRTIRVESEPAGAEVWVMDKSWGRTPVEIPLKEVFPASYSPFKHELVGKVKLVREGCEPLTLPVGSRGAGSRLTARLECTQPIPEVAPLTPEPRMSSPAPAASAPEDTASVPAAERPVSTAKEHLLQLRELREAGLISEDEYRQLRRRVLDRF